MAGAMSPGAKGQFSTWASVHPGRPRAEVSQTHMPALETLQCPLGHSMSWAPGSAQPTLPTPQRHPDAPRMARHIVRPSSLRGWGVQQSLGESSCR